jgi:hypothetical protein
MIRISTKGDLARTREFLDRLRNQEIYNELDIYGKMGVEALSQATPVETSLTAHSWQYRIIRDRKHTTIEWYNTHSVNGTPLVILLQYGHATGTGGYVQGRDFINPAMRPVFDHIADSVWRKVVKS